MNFIKTSDGELAQRMITLGFTVLDCSGGIWTFLNDKSPKLNFSNEDKKHVVYSDMLNI